MAKRNYRIVGRVVDRARKTGVPGLVVEAWDRDTRYHDMLGSTISNADGMFSFTFDEDYFGDYAPDVAPDVFFKIFRDGKLVKTTFEEPLKNMPAGETRVTLEVDLGTAPAAGKDRITTGKMLKAARFFRMSDFSGVAKEQRDKASVFGKFVTAVGGKAVAEFDFEPIQSSGPQTKQVVGQDVSSARNSLAAQKVQVNEVKTYDPRADTASLRAIADFPLQLKADDQVTLYEENGTVRYYSIVKPVDAAKVDAGTVVRIDKEVQTLKANVAEVAAVRADLEMVRANTSQSAAQLEGDVATMKTRVEDVARLKVELAAVQQSAADKDAQILKLQSDMASMQAAQRDINTRFSPDKLVALEQQVQKLALVSQRVVSQPAQAAKPAPARTATTKTSKPKGKTK